ncbi:hypothetical protein SCA6_003528 [Theobroma cacao]
MGSWFSSSKKSKEEIQMALDKVMGMICKQLCWSGQGRGQYLMCSLEEYTLVAVIKRRTDIGLMTAARS